MILCCRIPEIPIAALLLRQGGALRHRPLVVGGHPSERKPVRAASPEAQAFGVCAGMPLRQAEQLCPQAAFFPLDPDSEADLARHLLAGLYGLAPRVELAETGEAYVDLHGMVRATPGSPGGEAELDFARRVGDHLERRLLTRPALGLAANKFTAWVAAAGGATEPRLVPAGSERSFLATLPVATSLPGMAELARRLQLFGLRTMGDLAAMPLAAVEGQFGGEGLLALRLARGEDSRPLLAWEPPQRMEEKSRLDPAVDNLEPLLFLARGLVDRLGERLQDGAYAVTAVRLRLELEDAPTPAEAVLRLRAPMGTGEDLWLPISGLIRRQRLDRPVAAIAIKVSGFCPAGTRQMDLLARRDGRLEDLVRQLAVLAEAHGPRLVQVPELAVPGSLLEERRHRWRDPAEVLVRRAQKARRPRRAVAVG